MKKMLVILFTIIIIIVTIVYVKYNSYKRQYNSILKENMEYEQYKDKDIFGTELGTLINKTVDKNTKNKIVKDEDGVYIENNENSIKIEIYIQDNEQTYKMETFYNTGMEKFIQYYGNIKFQCSEIEYHQKTKRIKYILFEQLTS